MALTGCGFSPLYGNDNGAPVAAQLDQVQIANIPERTGQLLRQSLEDKFQADGAPTQSLYVLNVTYAIIAQGIGIQQDTSVTRNRFTATATWSLSAIGAPAAPLITGQAGTEDAENIIDAQYFAQTLETNTVDRQLADEVAAQITSQVAAYFKTHSG